MQCVFKKQLEQMKTKRAERSQRKKMTTGSQGKAMGGNRMEEAPNTGLEVFNEFEEVEDRKINRRGW